MTHLFKYIMYKGLAMAGMLLLNLCAYGQESSDTLSGIVSGPTYPDHRIVMHSTMVGVGSSNVLDTYLAPYNYTGTDIRLQRETMRMTKLWKGRVTNQSLIDINGAINKNHAGNHDEYTGGIRYSQGWFYNFYNNYGGVVFPSDFGGRRFNVAAGLAASGYLGAVYIDRSGNNPAQAKADVMIDASALVTYDMRIAYKYYRWRYQVSIPLMGVAFSPNYGQSYYEAFSMGNYDHNVVFAYPGNMPSMRHRLTLDIPVKHAVIRIGYVAQFNQSMFNHLKYHSYSHDFMIGFSKTFLRL